MIVDESCLLRGGCSYTFMELDYSIYKDFFVCPFMFIGLVLCIVSLSRNRSTGPRTKLDQYPDKEIHYEHHRRVAIASIPYSQSS